MESNIWQASQIVDQYSKFVLRKKERRLNNDLR